VIYCENILSQTAFRKVAMISGSVVSAYVLITVPAKRSGDLVNTLLDEFPQFIKEAEAVYGEADVIARVETSSVDELHKLVMDNIQKLPNVTVTRTFIIIPNMRSPRTG
jgi:DNA-binding Lrp family transcriptional regulator